jgi:hypothetical protein
LYILSNNLKEMWLAIGSMPGRVTEFLLSIACVCGGGVLNQLEY